MLDNFHTWLENPVVGKFLIAAAVVLVVVTIPRLINGSGTWQFSNVDNRYRLGKFTSLVSYAGRGM